MKKKGNAQDTSLWDTILLNERGRKGSSQSHLKGAILQKICNALKHIPTYIHLDKVLEDSIRQVVS